MFTKRQKKIKWGYMFLAFVLLIFTNLSAASTGEILKIRPDEVNFKIIDAKLKKNTKMQPGDSFSINLSIQVSEWPKNKGGKLYFDKAYVTGAITKSSKPTLQGEEGGGVIDGNSVYNLTVSGLYYSGEGDLVSVSIGVRDSDNQTSITNSEDVSISGYTIDEIAEGITVDNTNNLIVKNNETQKVTVKVTNKGKMSINSFDAQLTLDNKVEGLSIKNNTAKCSNLKAKETKNLGFTISATEDAKAGIYPATVTMMGNSYPVKIQIDSNVVPSALEVGVSGSNIFTPGMEKEANFTITNVGDRAAKNIRIELVNTENVSVTANSNVKRINVLNANAHETIKLKVRVNKGFKGESVALPIKLTYLSSTGEAAEDQQYVYLYTNTTAAASATEVMISNVISPTGRFDVDHNFTVKFNVKAKTNASNIQITAEGDEGIVPKSQNLFFLNKMTAGEVKQYSVTFAATREAVSSSHPIKITVTYGKGDDATTINQYGSVNIYNSKKEQDATKENEKDEPMKNKPKVIIGEYSIEPTIVKAGENFELKLTFLNTSKSHTVHNLKANIMPVDQQTQDDSSSSQSGAAADPGNVFTPVGGSNTIYIADLAVGQTYTKKLKMYTIPSASAKTYQVTVDMAYEDEKGNEMTATECIGIPVEQVTKIEIGDIYVQPGEVGMPTTLSATFYNRGRTNISNMMVYIEGEGFSVQENKDFIGNFEIGDNETYEPSITPEQSGTLSGTLVVEYEDPTGEQQVLKEPFEFQVEESGMQDGDMPMDMPEEQTQSSKKPLIIIVGSIVGVLLVIAIIVLIIKKKAKNKARALEDEDEED